MVFLGISLIILCLLLVDSANNVEKVKKEIKDKIKKLSKELIEDAFQAGYESGFAEAEGSLKVESCQKYVERKMRELNDE